MPTIRIEPTAEHRTRVGVLHAHGELRMLALEAVEVGATILALDGVLSPTATRYTIQIGAGEHLGIPEGTTFEQIIARYPWQFLNHACRPNTLVRGRELIAVAPIAPYDELSFDYETTEWQMAEPFQCRCGSCGGRPVRGFRFLERAERETRMPSLARHLRARLDDFGERA